MNFLAKHKKIQRVVHGFFGLIFTPLKWRRYIAFNQKKWKKWKVESPDSEIIMDNFSQPDWIIPNSFFANVLAKKNNSTIKVFAKRKYLDLFHLEILNSFNCNDIIIIKLKSLKCKKDRDKLVKRMVQSIKSKQDLFELKVDGIMIGVTIYETYLRRGNRTVDVNDKYLLKLISEAAEYFIFWQEYINTNNVSAVLLSHDCYNKFDILAKICYNNNIPVYMVNPYNFQVAFEPHSLYKYRFSNYKKVFDTFSNNRKEEALKLSKDQLNKRLKGEVGVDMRYSTASSFTRIDGSNSVLKKSNRLKLVICTHCFFDNPHAYGGMLFIDFFEWLIFLGKISEESDYDWYIKPHPDYLPGTIEIIEDITATYKNIKLINPEISFHQLKREGISFALTCYGSVGHELPLLGINVINAGYNPHSAYDFNFSPKTLDEYKEYLINLHNIKKNIEVNQIYEFYYMNYYYHTVDDLFYLSFQRLLDKVQSRGDINWRYSHFLDQHTNDQHINIIYKMEKFIESGKHGYFLDGPE